MGSQNGSRSTTTDQQEGKGGEKENLDDVEEREQILDMPPSWVGKLSIARERVALRYGNTGCRTVLYERAKMEVFAPGANDMGLLTRLTVFKVYLARYQWKYVKNLHLEKINYIDVCDFH